MAQILFLFICIFNRDDENCVVCTCGQPATKLTVKKDGPNKGNTRAWKVNRTTKFVVIGEMQI